MVAPAEVTVIPGAISLFIGLQLFLSPVAFGTFSGLDAQVFSHGYQVKNIVRQLGISSSVVLSTLVLHLFSTSLESLRQAQALTAFFVSPGVGSAMLLGVQQIFALFALVLLPWMLLVAIRRMIR